MSTQTEYLRSVLGNPYKSPEERMLLAINQLEFCYEKAKADVAEAKHRQLDITCAFSLGEASAFTYAAELLRAMVEVGKGGQ